MSATVWSKFYWSDWLSDAGLRRSSFAAKGLWIDMLCIAAQSDPIGYLTVKKVPLSVHDIARMCGGSEPEVGTLLTELEGNGVLSRDRNGIIYSRRMVRDDKKARTAKKIGKEGGNPELRRGTVAKADRVRPYRRTDSPEKTRRIFDRSNGKCHWCQIDLVWDNKKLVPNLFHVDHLTAVCDGGTNDEDNLVAACAKCNHARARIDWENPSDTNPDRKADTKPHIPLTTSQKKNSYDEKFEEAWQGYPRRDGGNPKAPAAKRFLSAVKAGFDPQIIIDGVKRFAVAEARNVGTPYIPQMVKWLNDQRWMDYGPDCAIVKFDIRKHLV